MTQIHPATTGIVRYTMEYNAFLNILCLVLLIGTCIVVWVADQHPVRHPEKYKKTCCGLKKFTSWYRRKLRSMNWVKIAPVGLGVNLLMVFVLTAVAGWCKNPVEGPAEIIYKGLEYAFGVLEGNGSDFRSYASKLWFLPHIPSIMVPVFAAVTAVTLIWNYLPHHVPWFSRVWHIFSELEPNSIRMAKSIQKEMDDADDTGVFIFLRTRRGNQEPGVLDELKDLNYFFYPGDESRFLSRKNRRKRILRFFFLTENTEKNFNQMQDFLTAADKNSLLTPIEYGLPDGQFQHELYLLSETESAPMLIDHLRESLKKSSHQQKIFRNTDLRLLDRFRAVSYDLLSQKPLYMFHEDNQLNILLLGFGHIGREVFRAAWSMGVLPDCTTTFTICDQDICTQINQFKTICPELRKAQNIMPRKLNADSEALDQLIQANTYHYIVVTLGDDERNIRVASRLKRYYRRGHWNDPHTIQPQICVNIEDPVKHNYTQLLWEAEYKWDKSIHTFGGLDEVFTQNVLMPVNLWSAARYVHKLVNDSHGKDLRLWSEYKRRSSISSATHAACYITHLLGKDCLDKDLDLPASYQAAWDALSPDQKDELISKEHKRWMAYVRSEGMQCSDIDLLRKYFPVIEHHVDIYARLTPCLVDTKDLDTVQEAVNQLQQQYWSADKLNNPPVKFHTRDQYIVEKAACIYKIIHPKRPPAHRSE